jgi:Zyg-11 family protein
MDKLKDIVELTLTAMNIFANHKQIHENSLLILYDYYILQNVTYDKFKCAQLVMDGLINL